MDMKLSQNLEVVDRATDEEFIVWLMYKRYDLIPRWELPLLEQKITERCNKLNLTWHWGCCGTNVIRRIEDER